MAAPTFALASQNDVFQLWIADIDGGQLVLARHVADVWASLTFVVSGDIDPPAGAPTFSVEALRAALAPQVQAPAAPPTSRTLRAVLLAGALAAAGAGGAVAARFTPPSAPQVQVSAAALDGGR